MATQVQLGDIAVDVVFKDIKNVHLSVYPPTGRVRIAAPRRMRLDTVRVFAVSKLAWIKKQQRKLLEQERETEREYVDRESHFVWGRRFLLTVQERDETASVTLTGRRLVLQVRPGTSETARQAIVDGWYRELLKAAVPELVAKWEPVLRVKVGRFHVQRMKNKWGSCNHDAGSIRLNAELARKPKECLEYIVVHEMVHLLEPTHNARFVALMDRHLPNWQHFRRALNRLPVRREDWRY